MNNGIIVWLVVFAVSAGAFFLIAAIVAVKGFGDLQKLLRYSKRTGQTDNDE